MKPLTNRIRDAAKRYNIARDIIELDYAISYLLTGIFTQDKLREMLVFKGGTALKKLYFNERLLQLISKKVTCLSKVLPVPGCKENQQLR